MAIQTAARLGLPVEPSKVEGPSSTLTFLGIEIDSAKRELRLPREKLLRLQRLLRDWEGKKAATKHDLQVIIGLLNDAAQVVPAGRPFLRNLIDAMAPLRKAHYVSRLNLGCRADLAWWGCFMERWNGVGLFPALPLGPSITADASGSWGAGAFLASGRAWFQIKWPARWAAMNIAAKELLPLVVAVAHIAGPRGSLSIPTTLLWCKLWSRGQLRTRL